jgi:hypothetical protein
MIREMTAAELEESCPTFIALKTKDKSATQSVLSAKYSRAEWNDEGECFRIYDKVTPEEVVSYLYKKGIVVTEITTDKIGLEEYYIDIMKEGK